MKRFFAALWSRIWSPQPIYTPLMVYCEGVCPHHRNCGFAGPALCPQTRPRTDFLNGVRG